MHRRAFFKSSLVGAGALAVPGCATDDSPSLGANPTWSDVRAQFELTRERIHMTGFLLASHPRPVADAIARHRAGFDRDPTTYLGAQNIVASVTPAYYSPAYTRLAPSLLTDESDVDRAVAAVAAL